MGVAGRESAAKDDMVTWNHQPARMGSDLQLNASSRTGRIPGPPRFLHRRRDVARRAPGYAIVVAAHSPNGARTLARAGNDLALAILTEIVRRKQPDCAGVLVNERTWIAARVLSIRPDDARIGKRFAAID